MALIQTPSPVERLLRPRSVVVLGEDADDASAARRLLASLKAGGFAGPVMAVGSVGDGVASVSSCPGIAALSTGPDLALIDLGAEALEPALSALARLGAGVAVLLRDAPAPASPLRLLGPGSAGVISPALRLNASLFPRLPAPGPLALVCQDQGIAAAVLDHAEAEGIGFSHVVTLGRNDDLGFTAVLDWLSRDGATRAVLLEVSRIKDRRGFLSAARAVSRGRAVVALRTAPDPAPETEAECALPSGLVFAAALRRAGVVDAAGLEGLLDAATTLARPRRMRGTRVAVVATTPALEILADRAMREAGAAPPDPEPAAAKPDPIQPLPDFHLASAIIAGTSRADAVVAVHAAAGEDEAALASLEEAHAAARDVPLLVAITGGGAAERARQRLAAAAVPAFRTVAAAARAAGTLIREFHTRAAARELPARTVLAVAPDRETARRVLAGARRAGRVTLTEDEAAAVLNAYGIPTAPGRVAADAESAAEAAAALGFPVVLKIRSPDLAHKTEVGGVVLDLETAEAVREAAGAMAARVARLAPSARREGFLVQRQIARYHRQELCVQIARDPLFGPAIGFGQGGTAAGISADLAADLPPLNRALAAALVSRTRIAALLAGFRDRRALDREAIHETLVRLSQLAVDFPDLLTADVNPLVAGESGVMALDAWIRIAPEPASGTGHLAIAPYPEEWVRRVTLADGRAVTLRPIRPEDAEAHAAFFSKLSPEDVRLRFFAPIRALTAEEIARLTQIDYDREMAIIASTGEVADPSAETLGVVRIVRSGGSGDTGEFAIVVRSDVKGAGLGSRLMQAGIAWARAAGLRRIVGDVLAENGPMLAFVRRLGFTVSRSPEDPEVMVATMDLVAGRENPSAPAG